MVKLVYNGPDDSILISNVGHYNTTLRPLESHMKKDKVTLKIKVLTASVGALSSILSRYKHYSPEARSWITSSWRESLIEQTDHLKDLAFDSSLADSVNQENDDEILRKYILIKDCIMTLREEILKITRPQPRPVPPAPPAPPPPLPVKTISQVLKDCCKKCLSYCAIS